MKFDIALLKACGAAFIGYLMIFFIALRIQNNSNNMKKALLSLFLGLGILSLNIIAVVLDYLLYGFQEDYLEAMSPYFGFPIMALVFVIVVPLVFFIIGKKNNQKLSNSHTKLQKEIKRNEEKPKPVLKDEIEYLYLALKYDDKFYLKEVEVNGNKEYGGLAIKFPSDEYFHDEFIKEVIQSFGLDVTSYHLAGTAIQKKNDSKNIKYYVYQIDLYSITDKINDLVGVSPVVLYGFNLSEMNKKILFHVVLRDYFEIEL